MQESNPPRPHERGAVAATQLSHCPEVSIVIELTDEPEAATAVILLIDISEGTAEDVKAWYWVG